MSKRAKTPIDAAGTRLRDGARVRVVGAPDLSGLERAARLESEPVFRYIHGKYKRVSGIDINGMAELSFSIRKGPLSGRHRDAIESPLVRVHRAKPGAKPSGQLGCAV